MAQCNRRFPELVLVFSFAIPVGLFAQSKSPQELPSKQKFLGIHAGALQLASVDWLYSPFAYSGSAPVAGIQFGVVKNKFRFRTQVWKAKAERPAQSLKHLTHTYPENHYLLKKQSFILAANTHFQYRISPDNRGHVFFVSGLWYTGINITTNAMGAPELVQSGIAPGIAFEKLLRQHRLGVEGHVSLLSVNLRNHYSLSLAQTYERLKKSDFVRQNIHFQTPKSAQKLFLSLTYAYPLSENLLLGVDFHSSVIRNSLPAKLASKETLFTINLNYLLK